MAKLWLRYDVEKRWVDWIDHGYELGVVKEHYISLTLSQEAYLASPNIRLVIVTDAVENKGVLGEVPNQWRHQTSKMSRSSLPSQTATALVLMCSKSRMHTLRPVSQESLTYIPGRFRILYDKVHAFSLESPTKFVSLQGTDDFAEFSPYEYIQDQRAAYYYAAVVFCISSETPAYTSLPETVVRNIGRYLVEKERDPIACARTLLNYSLISKTWSNIFHGLVWTHSSWTLGDCRPHLSNIRALTTSLRAYPKNAERMICYPAVSLVDYNEKDLASLPLCAEFLFGAAIHLTSITLYCYEFNQSKSALAQLKEVEMFEVWGRAKNMLKELLPVEVGEVLRTISSWSRLKTLVVNGWVCDRNQFTVDAPAAYRLTTLTLLGPKRLAAPLDIHLHHLLSHSSHHQNMEKVRLEYIQGLSNLGLYNFLRVVAPTLKELHIEHCTITVSAPSPEISQGLAIDASIGDMRRLEGAILQGDLVSNLTISRKLPSSSPSTAAPGKPGLHVTRWARIHTLASTDPHGLGLAQALRETGWGSIVLVLVGYNGWRSNFEEAHIAAKERNIAFQSFAD